MASIKINIEKVILSGENIQAAKRSIDNVNQNLSNIRSRIASNVLSRNNISGNLKAVQNELTGLSNKLNSIKRVSDAAANQYRNVDLRNKKMSDDLLDGFSKRLVFDNASAFHAGAVAENKSELTGKFVNNESKTKEAVLFEDAKGVTDIQGKSAAGSVSGSILYENVEIHAEMPEKTNDDEED